MNNQQSRRKAFWRVTTGAAAGFTLALGTLHLACSQGSGGGGPNLGGLNKIIQPVANAVGVDQRVTNVAGAGLNVLDKAIITPEREDGMGQAVAISLTNEYDLTKDEALNKYVALVGLTLVNSSPRPVGNWQFGVLESGDVNAFAGPNGYIFVTRGALDVMENEAQLAGVIAHEIVHVLHHHGLNGVRADANTELLKTLADSAIDDRTGLVKQLATPTLKTVTQNGYGQSMELDADRTAIQLMVAAGYDPRGLPQFLQKLESRGGGLFSTHPGKPERISRANTQIAQLGNPTGKTLKERFEKNVR